MDAQQQQQQQHLPDNDLETIEFLRNRVTPKGEPVKCLVVFLEGKFLKTCKVNRSKMMMQPGFTWVSTSHHLGAKGNVSKRTSLKFLCNVDGVAHYFALYPGDGPAKFAVDPVHGRHCFKLREINQRSLMPEYQVPFGDVVQSYGHFRYFLIEEHDFTSAPSDATVVPVLDNLLSLLAAKPFVPNLASSAALDTNNIDEYLTKAE
jgi:hypothetical protein